MKTKSWEELRMTKRNLPIIKLVLCEVIEPTRLTHDGHELVMLPEKYVSRMVKEGIVRVIDEQIIEPTEPRGSLVQIAQPYWNGVVIRIPDGEEVEHG
jgi:hypothetical protein